MAARISETALTSTFLVFAPLGIITYIYQSHKTHKALQKIIEQQAGIHENQMNIRKLLNIVYPDEAVRKSVQSPVQSPQHQTEIS